MKKNNKSFITLLTLATVFSCSGVCHAEITNIYSQCYTSKLLGSNIGRFCEVQSFDSIAKTYTTKRNYDLKISRLGDETKLHQESVFIEDINGNPLTFSANNETKGEKLSLTGEILSDGKIKIKKNLNESKSEETIVPLQKLLFPKAINDLFKGNKDNFEYSTIDTSTGFIITKIIAEKQADDQNKYKILCDTLPNIASYEWHDDSGKLLKSKIDKLNMELLPETEETKLQNDNLGLDLLKSTLITSNEKFEQTDNLKQINYKIESDDNSKIIFPEDERQSVIQKVGNSLFVKIKDEEIVDNSLLTVNKMDIYLKSGDIIAFDENMKSIATQIVGGETNAYKAAKKLENWVNSYIINKNYTTPFAGSMEVFKTKEGDCTEHSVLLAAVLRSVGIPSQVATGLYYTNPEGAFAYHMWTKAYIGNRWINLDATLKENTFNPLHIEFAESPLNTFEDKINMVIPIISNLSKLKVSVLNYYKKAKTVSIDLSDSTNKSLNPTVNIDLSNGSSSAVEDVNVSCKSSSVVSEVDLSNGDVDKCVDNAYLLISKGEIEKAKDSFESASRNLSFNDDFASFQLAQKMANAGFFILADKQLKTINENEIWKNQIINIKSAYYPLEWSNKEKESLYVTSTARFNQSVNLRESLIKYLENQKDVFNDDNLCYLSGEGYFTLKEYKTAQKYFDKAVKLNPINQRYRLALAKCFLALNEAVKAQNELLYLSNSVTDEKFNNIVMAELFLAKSELSKANSPEFLYYQSKYDALNGDYKKAQDNLKTLIVKHPKYSNAYSLMGDISYKLNEFDNALINYNSAIKYNNRNEKAYLGLGNIFLFNNKKQDAEKVYLRALKLNSKNIEALQKLADLAKKNGQTDLALNYNQEILKISPLNFSANLEIGFIKIYLNQSESASPYLKKALSINPYLSDCWIELAKIEVKKKNYFIARSYLKNTATLDSKNPQYYYYMGIIDNVNGDNRSARDNFERATMLKPNYTEAIEQLEKLN